ncbi:MAG TPA: YdbL family protein [Lacunisphaera sp.]
MNRSRFLTLCAAFCLVTLTVFAAESAADIRRRMEQRLPAIDSLKTSEAIGENNRGLLEVRGSGGADASSVVAEENRDREVVYALIAKETGATSDSVGRARAKQIAANSRPGVWVQEANGTWRKR